MPSDFSRFIVTELVLGSESMDWLSGIVGYIKNIGASDVKISMIVEITMMIFKKDSFLIFLPNIFIHILYFNLCISPDD